MAPLPEILERLLAHRRRLLGSQAVWNSSGPASNGHKVRSAESVTRDAINTIASSIKSRTLNIRDNGLSPRAAAPTANLGQGTSSPGSFNNAGMLALFAILGAGMVVASLWFFFWAKNGGFKWRQGDWDDYKSTVLRRKGPDGKTLSNATKSTKLGGGTIAGSQHYKWQQSVARSVVGYDEKGRKGIRAVRGWGKTHSITYSDDRLTRGTQTVSDMTEVRTEYDPGEGHHSTRYRDRDVQEYKREKPARVGGMNRVADGSHYDYSQSGSDLMSDTMTQLTENSEQPMLQKSTKEGSSKKDKQRQAEKDKERAERKAREQAAKMERRWKREAEQAAASMATYSEIGSQDDIRPPPSVATNTTRRSAAPALRPANRKLRRETSPKKAAPPPSEMTSSSRDFSYTTGEASEILSTIYSEGTGTRAPSYYDEYRPRATEHHHHRYSTEQPQQQQQQQHASSSRSRQSSPRKKPTSSNRYQGAGYRRGGMDSDLE